LFSTGGSNPGWSEIGKKWNSKRALKQHIAASLDNWGSTSRSKNKVDYYKDCDIVCYTMVVKGSVSVKEEYELS